MFEKDDRLLKMIERLLEEGNNLEQVVIDENLKKYHESAKKIDQTLFDKIVSMIKDIENHSHSLEEELVFLQEILELYNQLNLMQHRFRRVYSRYSDKNLELSDLEQIDIDVLNSRVSVIGGYLQNIKNIDDNKRELEELSQNLITENKKKDILSQRLLHYDEELKNNFLNAEGRLLVSGNIKYTSVPSEYKECGLDIRMLLEDTEMLDTVFKQATDARSEMDEKLSTAEICYDTMPNSDNKGILATIKIEAVKARYKLSLVKMLKLLSSFEDSYDGAKSKREKLLDLIRYRATCQDKLGVKFTIDPFGRTKVREQIEAIEKLGDNSRLLSDIRKRINVLNVKTEEMVNQNGEFLRELNDKRPLLRDNLSMASIDISGVELDYEDEESIIDNNVLREIMPNQVVRVGSLPDGFLSDRAIEKTQGVIKRVYEMMSEREQESLKEDVVPELVIEAKEEDVVTDRPDVFLYSVNQEEEEDTWDNFFDIDDDVLEEEPEVIDIDESKEDLFAEVQPFDYEPAFFTDKVDDTIENVSTDAISHDVEENTHDKEEVFGNLEENIFEGKIPAASFDYNSEELDKVSNQVEETDIFPYVLPTDLPNEENVEMPDAFWVTQESDEEIDSSNVLSFDEQINRLLSSENITKEDDNVKTRKLVA